MGGFKVGDMVRAKVSTSWSNAFKSKTFSFVQAGSIGTVDFVFNGASGFCQVPAYLIRFNKTVVVIILMDRAETLFEKIEPVSNSDFADIWDKISE